MWPLDNLISALECPISGCFVFAVGMGAWRGREHADGGAALHIQGRHPHNEFFSGWSPTLFLSGGMGYLQILARAVFGDSSPNFRKTSTLIIFSTCLFAAGAGNADSAHV